jgi:glycine cleavage system H lipoate-binding protein
LGTLKADVSDTLQKGMSGVTEAAQKELGAVGETTTKEAGKKAEEELIKSLEKQFK